MRAGVKLSPNTSRNTRRHLKTTPRFIYDKPARPSAFTRILLWPASIRIRSPHSRHEKKAAQPSACHSTADLAARVHEKPSTSQASCGYIDRPGGRNDYE